MTSSVSMILFGKRCWHEYPIIYNRERQYTNIEIIGSSCVSSNYQHTSAQTVGVLLIFASIKTARHSCWLYLIV